MNQFDILVKAFVIGITGTTMPLSILIYLVYNSIKNGGKIGKSIFFGHFIVEITLILITYLGATTLLESVAMQIIVSLAACAICIGYGSSLSKKAVVGIKEYKSLFEDDDILEEQMSDIYSVQNSEKISEQEYEKKKTFSSKAMLAGILLSVTNLNFIIFVAISVPAMTFQTNISFGGNVDFLTTLLFLVVFMLGEFVLYIFLPKIIALVRRWIDNKILFWITAATAVGFFALAITNFISMMNGFKFI